jgi:AcrR family transcriptional regulator
MSGRRTDTRARIQRTALDLFTEQGYDATSLREIAERLGVTKAALYYHFKTKESILDSIIEDLAAALDELIEWRRSQPPTAETRREVLRRLATLVQGPWHDVIRFGQANQAALRGKPVGDALGVRMVAVLGLVVDPGAPLVEQVRSALALIAVYLGNLPAMPGMPVIIGADATAEARAAAAMAVAEDLVGRGSS